MPTNPSEKKADRLGLIEALLLEHPEGLTQAEIARRLGVDRSTVHRYYPNLPKHIYVEDDGRWMIDRQAYLVAVRFNLHEALAVHLATRLLATRMDRHNPHAAGALRKLSLALERLAPRISHHLANSADVMDDPGQRIDPVFLGVLEKLTLAWAEERKVRVWHRHEDSGQVNEYLFSPYFIEPYAVGQAVHVIGWREPPGALRTFKVERIERAELEREHYTIPPDFDPRRLLADAWGIWYTEGEPVEVVLKFGSRVANRVRETRWHRSEQVTQLEDGGLLWRARVAEPQEMLPWIRGWGADCEVLEPERVRQQITQESNRLVEVYQAGEHSPPPVSFSLWAKANRKAGVIHPLIYHLIDVANVTLALWNKALAPQMRRQFSGWLGLNDEETGRLLAFWAGLHDLGKAGPAFQRRYSPAIEQLQARGLIFPEVLSPDPAAHGVVSTWALQELLVQQTGLEKSLARRIARSLGGHHGSWPIPDYFLPGKLKQSDKGDASWEEARRELAQSLYSLLKPPAPASWPAEQPVENALLTLFSGLVSVADWIGSMENLFPYEPLYMGYEKYAEKSAGQALSALERLGWGGWKAAGQTLPFPEMFPFPPNAIQQAVIETAHLVESPCLLILEAPTGSGKTEAALYLADTWLQAQQGGGLYIAMPTQATSNQMFERLVRYLRSRYPEDAIQVQLIHGQSQLMDFERTPNVSGVSDDEIGDDEVATRAMTWFLPRKRSLLAPFGVGTVDQTLMSVLQTRHFFVRLFGLSSKVVVFDEVHAYDTYMSTLFHRLLEWLRAAGVSVILLSATLPEVTRKELVQAYCGRQANPGLETAYPRLTLAWGQAAACKTLPAPEPREVKLEWIDNQAGNVVAFLQETLTEGGCAAVICNRVGRAQEVYRAIRKAGLADPQNILLFHARYPFAWRKEIEEKVLRLFSKGGGGERNPDRPVKAIVIATQVIEQSLDLDFDLIVSDLAPIDLLIQRAGRLHRHPQNNDGRPEQLKAPRLALCHPEMNEQIPNFGADRWVYEEYVLLASWMALQDRGALHLPGETSLLIEQVYGNFQPGNDPKLTEALQQTRERMRRQREKEIFEARTRLIPRVDDEELFDRAMLGLEEDDPRVHRTFQALTRLIEEGVTLICLHRTPAGLLLESDGNGEIVDLERPIPTELVRSLLHREVTLQHRGVVEYFRNQGTPTAWRRSAALRYHYPAIFENGRCVLSGTPLTLILDRETGLEVLNEKEVE